MGKAYSDAAWDNYKHYPGLKKHQTNINLYEC